MKKWLGLFLLSLITHAAFSQPNISPLLADSLKRTLTEAKEDTNKVLLLVELTRCYTSIDSDVALQYARQAKALANRLDFVKGKIAVGIAEGFILAHTNEYASGLAILIDTRRLAERFGTPQETAVILANIAFIYTMSKDNTKAAEYLEQAKIIQKTHPIADIHLTLGVIYQEMGRLDTALVYLHQAYQTGLKYQLPTYVTSSAYFLGTAYAASGQTDSAMVYYRRTLAWNQKFNIAGVNARAYQGLAKVYKDKNQLDSTLFYGKRAIEENGNHAYHLPTLIEASTLLSQVYEQKNNQREAFHYFKIAMAAKDSLTIQEKNSQIKKLAYEEEEREIRTKRRIEANQAAFQRQLQVYALSGILGVVALLAFILFRNNRQKQKANNLLHRQKEEINRQHEKAEKALIALQATQNQLIQSEKLASLGELTAGIAHEIQNPLNFVNNFSELSIELAKELKVERLKSKEERDEELENELVDDLIQNQEKINLHGKRASSIVKGMLEHSRTSKGERELTDINQLADEYLRIAYHGMKAKNQNFESDYELIPSKNLPKIQVIPQEIGRVLLNLINNAFYAVNVGSDCAAPAGLSAVQNAADVNKPSDGYKYMPKVTVTTTAANSHIEIRITDNGNGMSEATKAKIFQPFFTTKPTGEGTGLGLSLAYDIITKGHGGAMKVESVENEGTTFIVQLLIH
ncbi:tetratricopeptide repeat protein [Runella sp. CRIBMP]|uniref:tetratricopeptide repeat-containing sensor histidine kinase n=1 Tax=Runella sp. CRIBMP TaxID=2683261 RepID=UPI001412F86F|nr:ATP-binding protein [Runella sp. CRIBMP]NBB21636.1 tetratricopeptide repeat protein [Runella sp. CRIBMP]